MASSLKKLYPGMPSCNKKRSSLMIVNTRERTPSLCLDQHLFSTIANCELVVKSCRGLEKTIVLQYLDFNLKMRTSSFQLGSSEHDQDEISVAQADVVAPAYLAHKVRLVVPVMRLLVASQP